MSKKFTCPDCGVKLVKEIEPDEKPDGTILGYPIWICPKCKVEVLFNRNRNQITIYNSDDHSKEQS